MKLEIAEIVGKRIAGVIVKEKKENVRVSSPRHVFLIFEDGTHFEFYANSEVTWSAGVRPGGIDWVRNYCATHYQVSFEHIDSKFAENE